MIFDFFNCSYCQPFSDCSVPMIAGLIGGSVQYLKSKNYSAVSFATGMLSSLSVATIFCWVSKDFKWFQERQNTVNAIAWVLGISSTWIIDVAIPKIRNAALKRAEKEVKE